MIRRRARSAQWLDILRSRSMSFELRTDAITKRNGFYYDARMVSRCTRYFLPGDLADSRSNSCHGKKTCGRSASCQVKLNLSSSNNQTWLATESHSIEDSKLKCLIASQSAISCRDSVRQASMRIVRDSRYTL